MPKWAYFDHSHNNNIGQIVKMNRHSSNKDNVINTKRKDEQVVYTQKIMIK
jgi:hypothetical protein